MNRSFVILLALVASVVAIPARAALAFKTPHSCVFRDESSAVRPLVLTTNGNLHGVAPFGGDHGYGTIVEIVRTPDVTSRANPPSTGSDGKLANVNVNGSVAANMLPVELSSGRYSARDSMGLVAPSGSFMIAQDGTFAFKPKLTAQSPGPR